MNSPRSPSLSSEIKSIITDQKILTLKTRMRVLAALDENRGRVDAEKQRNLRILAIREILTSEMTYLRQLEVLTEFFILPILEKKLINHVLITNLNDNLKTLYNINGELLEELKQDPENVAGAFFKLAPFFKLYSVYAYDYEQIRNLFQEVQQSNPELAKFISDQESRPEVCQKLPALLITPIQRIPRYKLLLQKVLQHTPVRHKDYRTLQACLVEIEKSVLHINSLLKQTEETRKLLTVQKRIVNKINLVIPGRRVIKEGTLMRLARSGNAVYKRYFILFNDILIYCKGDKDSPLRICCIFPVNKCKVESVLSGGLFRVTCVNEVLLLYGEKEECSSWIRELDDAIKKYSDSRQTLRKESSSREPLRHRMVQKFHAEDLSEKYKRKRAMLNLDSESSMTNEDSASSPLCSLRKRLKRNKNDEGDSRCPLDFVESCTIFKNCNTECSPLRETADDSFSDAFSENQPDIVRVVELENGRRISGCGNNLKGITETIEIDELTEDEGEFENKGKIERRETKDQDENCTEEFSNPLKMVTEFFTSLGTSIKSVFSFK